MRGHKKKYPPLTEEQRALINRYLGTDDFSVMGNYKVVKKCIYSVLKRRVSPQDMDDYIGIAHLALIKAAHNFRPNKKMSFSSFASMNIQSAIKTELTHEGRDCRVVNKLAKSLDAPINEAEGLCLKDLVTGNPEISIQEFDRIAKYLRTLPDEAKEVLKLRLEGQAWIDIRKQKGYTTQEMREIMLKMQKYENVQILRRENCSYGKE